MNFQRKGSVSNTLVGTEFEEKVFEFFIKNSINLEKQKKVEKGTAGLFAA